MASGENMDAVHRFMGKFHIVDECSCWVWHAAKHRFGYGMFAFPNRKTVSTAHRVSWLLFMGEIPDGMHVLHKCDVPACVNPDHLFLGSHQENMTDKAEKGRAPSGENHWSRRAPDNVARGERSGHARLTEEDVASIRAGCSSGVTQKEMSRKYSIDPSHVSDIVNRKRWAHV